MSWRVGRKLGRTLYENDRVVGMVDTPELAERIVKAMNLSEVYASSHLIFLRCEKCLHYSYAASDSAAEGTHMCWKCRELVPKDNPWIAGLIRASQP